MGIGEIMRRTMRARGLTYAELGKRCDVTKQRAWQVLNERKDDDWCSDELVKWCKALGIDTSRFVGCVSEK